MSKEHIVLDIPIWLLALIVIALAAVFIAVTKALFGQGGQTVGLPPAPSAEVSIEEEVEWAVQALPIAEEYVRTFGDWPTGTNYQYAPNQAPALTESEQAGAREIFRLVRDGHLLVPVLIRHKVLQARGAVRPALFLAELRSFIYHHTNE